MSFLRRRPRQLVPQTILALLPAYGRAVLDARSSQVTDGHFGWSTFFQPVMTLMSSGDREQVISEIYAAAKAADNPIVASVGAYKLLAELQPESDDPRFLKLLDGYLEHVRSLGWSSGHLTGYEARRWIATHGDLRSSFDGIYEVAVPSDEDLAPLAELEAGETKLLVLTEPLPMGNEFFAERRTDGTYAVFSVRVHSSDDPTRTRYEETSLGTLDSLQEVYHAVGEMFGTRPYWADADLDPYFSSRRV